MISSFAALLFRSVGVLLCVAGTRLTWKERLFCLSLCLQSSSQLHLGQSGWMQPIKGCWKRKNKKDFQKVIW